GTRVVSAGARGGGRVSGARAVGGVERLQVGVVLGAGGAAEAAGGAPTGRGPARTAPATPAPKGPPAGKGGPAAKPGEPPPDWKKIDVTLQGGQVPPPGTRATPPADRPEAKAEATATAGDKDKDKTPAPVPPGNSPVPAAAGPPGPDA